MVCVDLVDMSEFQQQNKHMKYLLNVIDIFSKFAWSIPIKNKEAENDRGHDWGPRAVHG